MIFADIPVSEAAGTILAHSQTTPKRRLKKGLKLGAVDLAALEEAGIATVAAYRLEENDVPEDKAAQRLGQACASTTITTSAAFTGRCNLYAAEDGLLLYEPDGLNAVNRIDESITLALLQPLAPVHARQMIGTVKIIPFATPRAALENVLKELDNAPLLSVAPYIGLKAGLIETVVGDTAPKTSDKLRKITEERLHMSGASLREFAQAPHQAEDIGEAVTDQIQKGCDIVLIAGASATTDRRDVVPAGIVEAGGAIDHFGMPVDPGNLLLLGHIDNTPVIGMPGCAKSPKLNGFDWILQRFAAGLKVTSDDVMTMGSGGLLKEIGARPLPRAQAVERPRPATRSAPKIAAIVLAAGTSSRMGGRNKLLEQFDGAEMIRRTTENMLSSHANPIVVVTGRDADKISASLSGLDVVFADNPEFAAGMSGSLRAGLDALPEDTDGALICLGDMPLVSPDIVDRLIAAFDEEEGRTICLPLHHGKWGNPILWSRLFFKEMRAISGDQGARELLHTYAERICEVAVDSDGVLMDFDTPESLKDRAGKA